MPTRVAFPEQLPAARTRRLWSTAGSLGSRRRPGDSRSPAPAITTYVYPDRNSKLTLTGDQGDGHAVPSGVLHVIRFDPGPRGVLAQLVAHEATHAITGELWPPAGSSLLGEGLAVWVAGMYGGIALTDWQRKLGDRPAAATLLPSKAFRARPEAETYPVAGLLVTVATERVGLDNVRDHLYGATAETWADACKAAGTTAEALDAAVAARR